jgi:hypothetical protein
LLQASSFQLITITEIAFYTNLTFIKRATGRTNIMTKKYYAHSVPGEPPDKWQPLEEHLKNVAELAKSFAKDFNSGDWAYVAGLWHDLKSFVDEFGSRK